MAGAAISGGEITVKRHPSWRPPRAMRPLLTPPTPAPTAAPSPAAEPSPAADLVTGTEAERERRVVLFERGSDRQPADHA